MAESGLIAAYLNELKFSVAKLDDGDDIVAESMDHLETTVERLVAGGRSRPEAEAQALARFGSAALVSRVFIEEAKRGGAVSTRITRLGGLAAMLAPLLAIAGEVGNLTIKRGVMHGGAIALLVSGFVVFAFSLWALRTRHGGLGGVGRVAFWLFVASPFISAPFMWFAGVVFFLVQLVVVTLLGVGMLRARVLPRVPVALFSFAPVATVV